LAETAQVQIREEPAIRRPGETAESRLSGTKPVISVVLALYNYEEHVTRTLDALTRALEQVEREYEIICVDDGSQDRTSERVKEYIRRDPRVKLLRMRTAFGEASALEAGLKHTRGQKIVYLTGRVNVNPAEIPKLLAKLDEGYDLVVGWRHPRRDSRLNQFVSRVFNAIINWIAGLKLHDINSGVFAAKREVLESVPIYGDLNNFIPVLAVRQGYKVAEEKIEQLPGWFRTSRYVDEYIRRFLDIITVIFLTRYSKKPIHFLGFLGVVLTLVGAGINLYLFVYRVLQIGPIAGRPLLLLGALLLVIGIQMVSIGLIGEMIIFTHAKEIKEYNIEEVIA